MDFAVDCTEVLKVIETMFDMLGMSGKAVDVGVPPADAKIEVIPLAHLPRSQKYLGCRDGDSNSIFSIPHLCKMHVDGQFPVKSKHCLGFAIIRTTYSRS